ncbi:MAG: pilus (MSHA type) biogenesis protein MshL, partial [Rhodocyclaceae bacterium]|nr:pilus (MSHA type) biogenesis protein MshL [Rhodocyclaceae bacterium]
MTNRRHFAVPFLALAVAACAGAPIQSPGSGHIQAAETPAPAQNIPATVQNTVALPKPKAAPVVETYSVVVNNVRVQELLFALARDAKVNVDIHPGINGVVTLNAIDQTLQQILTRIGKQVDMRWELDGPNLAVMPDSPFLRIYKVDYVNMSRDVTGTVSISTQIASTSASATGAAATGASGNTSTTAVKSTAQNHFWESLDKNLKDMLRETDKILPEGSSETVIERADQQSTTGTGAPAPRAGGHGGGNPSSIAGSPNPAALQQEATTVVRRTTFREAASVIVNSEAGVVVVRATSRQHEKVQEYLDLVTVNSRRQVIIEATIAEVTLGHQYQQGINWQSLLTARPGSRSAGFSITQNSSTVAGAAAAVPGTGLAGAALVLNYKSLGYGITSALSLLETFGTVKVLSSPKISVLNNQTAMLKVVDNIVYFTVKSDTVTPSAGAPITTYTTTPQSVSVGLVMSVTPQISEYGSILLNVRPTISSLKGNGKKDPTPNLTVDNMVPEIQTREMESMLRLADGEIAVMGGLMEDKINYNTDAVPGLGSIPVIGNFFRNRNDANTKTELVIFLRPTVIRDPSINGDYRNFRDQLPDRNFLAPPPTQQP